MATSPQRSGRSRAKPPAPAPKTPAPASAGGGAIPLMSFLAGPPEEPRDQRQMLQDACLVLEQEYPDLPPVQRPRLERLALKLVELASLNRAIAAKLGPPPETTAHPHNPDASDEGLAALDGAIDYLAGEGQPSPRQAAERVASLVRETAEVLRRDGGAAGLYGKCGKKDAARLLREETRDAVSEAALPEEELGLTDDELLDQWNGEWQDLPELREPLERAAGFVDSHAAVVRLTEPGYVTGVLAGDLPPEARDAGRLLKLLPMLREDLAQSLQQHQDRHAAAARDRQARRGELTIWNDDELQQLDKQQEETIKASQRIEKDLKPWRIS